MTAAPPVGDRNRARVSAHLPKCAAYQSKHDESDQMENSDFGHLGIKYVFQLGLAPSFAKKNTTKSASFGRSTTFIINIWEKKINYAVQMSLLYFCFYFFVLTRTRSRKFYFRCYFIMKFVSLDFVLRKRCKMITIVDIVILIGAGARSSTKNKSEMFAGILTAHVSTFYTYIFIDAALVRR